MNQSSQHINASGTGTDGATTAATELAALQHGSVGAVVLQEPYLTQALESGQVAELANLDSGNTDNMPVSGYFALSSTATSDPNTIAAFQAGLAEAQAIGQSRVEVEAALTAAKLPSQVAATSSIGNYPTEIVQANLTNVLSLMSFANLQVGLQNAASLTGTETQT